MKGVPCLAGVICITLFGCSVKQDIKTDVPVLNIAIAELSAENVPAGDAAVIGDLLRGALVNTGAFRVVEKQNMDKILAEHVFQQTGCTSSECAVKLGKILNVQRMGVGSFGRLMGSYLLNIRVIDVESGAAICSQTARGNTIKEIDEGISRMAKAVAFNCENRLPPAKVDAVKEQSEELAKKPVAVDSSVAGLMLKAEGPPETGSSFAPELFAGKPLRIYPHEASVSGIGVSPDGLRVLALSYFKDAWIYKASSGARIGRIGGNRSWYYSVVFSPDGHKIALGCEEGFADVWDLDDGRLLNSLPAHKGGVRALSFLPDGRRLVTAGYGGEAKLWDLETGELKHTFSGHSDVIGGVSVSADGKRLATASDDGTAILWSLDTWERIRSFSVCSRYATSVALSADGSKLMAAGEAGTVKLWNANTGTLLHAMHGHGGMVYSCEISPDGKFALTAAADGNACLWSTRLGKPLKVFPGAHWLWAAPNGVAFFPDGKTVLVGCRNRAAASWKIGGLPD